MAGGSIDKDTTDITAWQPQWSPGLMAGGSGHARPDSPVGAGAAMEPRPDGRGKAWV